MRVSFANRSGLIGLLLVFCFFTFFLGLGSQAITDADEAFYAEASREMVESGDWLTPRFNYQHRWEKPVLYYWLTATTYLATGPNEFAARLWSALSGVGLALLAWAIARYATSRLDVAWLAGTIVATSFGYFAMARAALPDLPLTFCITLTIWAALRAIDVASERRAGPSAFAKATADRRSSESEGWSEPATKWWVLAGASAGAGFLMKGPVALVVPALVLLPIAWREWRRLRLEIRGMAVAVVTAAIVGLPWYVAMWLEHGNPYLQSFFVADNFERFATERFNEARPFWFYLPVLLGGLLPWSLFLTVFVVEGLAGARKRTVKLADTDWRLLLWAIMPLLFFTLSVGKQPRYILPVLPPLAVLLARGLIERIETAQNHRWSLGAATWATAAMYVALALLFVRMEPLLIDAYPVATWVAVCLLGCSAIALAGIAATAAWRHLPIVAGVAGVVTLVAVQYGALAGVRPEAVEQLAALIRTNRQASEPIGVFKVFSRNLGFYTGLPRMELFDPEQAAHFLQSQERVLLVVRSADLLAVEAASGMTLKKLGEARYLNTANVRLRTVLNPDPTTEIEMVSLVTNR
jgi:4-amino-4-deoxy-L-arabinose transferase-like glycosyltransferase